MYQILNRTESLSGESIENILQLTLANQSSISVWWAWAELCANHLFIFTRATLVSAGIS